MGGGGEGGEGVFPGVVATAKVWVAPEGGQSKGTPSWCVCLRGGGVEGGGQAQGVC